MNRYNVLFKTMAMKTIAFFLLFIISSHVYLQSQTQSLIGKILDANTKHPVQNVSVYLNGTSLQTMTDEDGMFIISTNKVVNTDLIISHVSYNMISIHNPFESVPDVIYLTKKENVLDDVVIVADVSMRKKYLKIFREHFLGITKAGKSCEIMNEDDIHLHFDDENNRLVASSDKPILIKNKYLKYDVKFTLIDFYVEYFSPPYRSSGVINVTQGNSFSGFVNNLLDRGNTFVQGTTSFVDLDPNNKGIKKRRDKVYESSSMSFFKKLSNNTLTESKYRVFYRSVQIDPAAYLSVKDTLTMKKVTLLFKPQDDDLSELEDGRQIKGFVDILDDKKERSAVLFLTDSFLVDQCGNINTIDKLLFSGYLGERRIGDLLPLDYEPSH